MCFYGLYIVSSLINKAQVPAHWPTLQTCARGFISNALQTRLNYLVEIHPRCKRGRI